MDADTSGIETRFDITLQNLVSTDHTAHSQMACMASVLHTRYANQLTDAVDKCKRQIQLIDTVERCR